MRSFKSCLFSLTLLTLLSACSSSELDAQDTSAKTLGEPSDYLDQSYCDSPYDCGWDEQCVNGSCVSDGSQSTWDNAASGSSVLSAEDEALVDELMALELGPVSEADLSDGTILVAGPAYGPEVALSCSEGALYVAAGSLIGSQVGSVIAGASVITGPGAVAIAPLSVGLSAVVGGTLGFVGSLSSWVSCIGGIAQIGIALFRNGYWSAANGIRGLVGQAIARTVPDNTNAYSPGQSMTSTQSRDCQRNGRLCRRMSARYHELFCDPLMEYRTQITGFRTGDVCAPAFVSDISCYDLERLVNLAAGCAAGRQHVGDRCYNGNYDSGHANELDQAYRDLDNCLLEFNNYCQNEGYDNIDFDEALDRADESFPECR